jgi:hypothetical protein
MKAFAGMDIDQMVGGEMRRSHAQLALLAAVVTAGVIGLAAGVRAGGVEPLQDHYQGPYGLFTHWSGVAEARKDNPATLAYSVCNVDPKKVPLYFYWDKPAFGSGWSYPLGFGSCATISRSVKKFKRDDATFINFTQHNEKWQARAYVPEESTQLPQDWFSRVQGFFFREGSTPRVVDVSLRVVVQENKRATYYLSWVHGAVVIGLGFNLDRLDEATRRSIIEALSRGDAQVRVARGPEFLAAQDRERLSGPAQEATYLVVRPRDGAPRTANFSYDAPSTEPVSAPIILADEENRVIMVGSYASVR